MSRSLKMVLLSASVPVRPDSETLHQDQDPGTEAGWLKSDIIYFIINTSAFPTVTTNNKSIESNGLTAIVLSRIFTSSVLLISSMRWMKMVHSVTPLLGTWVAHLIKKLCCKNLNTGFQSNSLHWHAFILSFSCTGTAHNVGAPNNFVFLNFVNYCKPKKRCGKIIIIYLSTLFLLSGKSYKSLMCLMIINKYNSNCVGVLSKTFDITDQH